MAVFLELQGRGVALRSASNGVQRPDAGVAQPGEDELSGHSRGNHLVVDQVRREAAQREIATALANDLVAGGEADEMSEAFDRDGVAVANELGYGIAHQS